MALPVSSPLLQRLNIKPRNRIQEKLYTSQWCLPPEPLTPPSHGTLQLGQQQWLLEKSSPAPQKALKIPNKGTDFASSFYKAFYGPGFLK